MFSVGNETISGFFFFIVYIKKEQFRMCMGWLVHPTSVWFIFNLIYTSELAKAVVLTKYLLIMRRHQHQLVESRISNLHSSPSPV